PAPSSAARTTHASVFGSPSRGWTWTERFAAQSRRLASRSIGPPKSSGRTSTTSARVRPANGPAATVHGPLGCTERSHASPMPAPKRPTAQGRGASDGSRSSGGVGLTVAMVGGRRPGSESVILDVPAVEECGAAMTTTDDALSNRWQELIGALDELDVHGGSDAPDAGDLGRELIARYREPHRHYHTAEHLLAVLEALDELTGTEGP